MAPPIDDAALDKLFRTARSFNGYTSQPVTTEQLHAIWELLKMGPTSANMLPARLVWCTSDEAKQKLAACCLPANAEKIRSAPVSVIIGMDIDYHEQLPWLFPHANVTLLNVAVSDHVAVAGMQIPRFTSGLSNYYQAHLDTNGGGLSVLTLPIDHLMLPTVRLVKMDVEGHERPALQGMRELILRDRPVLIVETNSPETLPYLASLDYEVERLAGSSNVVCRPRSGSRN